MIDKELIDSDVKGTKELFDEVEYCRYVISNEAVKIAKKDTITKDNRQLSKNQLKVLYYNGFDFSKVSKMTYKEISNVIGNFIARYVEAERTTGSLDDMEDWECPISPWGSDF